MEELKKWRAAEAGRRIGMGPEVWTPRGVEPEKSELESWSRSILSRSLRNSVKSSG